MPSRAPLAKTQSNAQRFYEPQGPLWMASGFQETTPGFHLSSKPPPMYSWEVTAKPLFCRHKILPPPHFVFQNSVPSRNAEEELEVPAFGRHEVISTWKLLLYFSIQSKRRRSASCSEFFVPILLWIRFWFFKKSCVGLSALRTASTLNNRLELSLFPCLPKSQGCNLKIHITVRSDL